MDRDAVIHRTREVRRTLQHIAAETDSPAVAHAAHQADVHCHSLLWELGAETATTPELDDRTTVGE